jgi:hypothetical protein
MKNLCPLHFADQVVAFGIPADRDGNDVAMRRLKKQSAGREKMVLPWWSDSAGPCRKEEFGERPAGRGNRGMEEEGSVKRMEKHLLKASPDDNHAARKCGR